MNFRFNFILRWGKVYIYFNVNKLSSYSTTIQVNNKKETWKLAEMKLMKKLV